MPRVPTVTPDAPAVLVQLSDSHLFAEADATLVGMNTRESLQRVIGLVREQQPRIDLLLATGGLVPGRYAGVLSALPGDDRALWRAGALDSRQPR